MTGFRFPRSLTETSQLVMDRLRRNNFTVVTAESCTGGLLTALLSQAEGAGERLQGGFVAYTKAQKTSALGLSADQLRAVGAVTGDVAARMAYGALSLSVADVAIGVTGVLGPLPDEDDNRVGLVYLAIRDKSGVQEIVKKDFGQLGHDVLTELTLDAALEALNAYLSRYEASLTQ